MLQAPIGRLETRIDQNDLCQRPSPWQPDVDDFVDVESETGRSGVRRKSLKGKSGREDLNLRPPGPEHNQSSLSSWFSVVLVRLNSAQFASFGENCSLNCSLRISRFESTLALAATAQGE